ncbi:hypothetical protein TGGT1_201900 [Toxoplasma gondii GT1]|uniref:Uncharacterized protein n=5 Tax=Toxoplasma gondii TaxID=5811 RepID=S7WB47_TOXGG|nr:hypothetical protein TGGT1_201900 [Toxoplasma gondii GT1]KAF4642974.1 hypothetical protein TGRH88_037030 [Toxoplasma gondii]
MWISLVVPLVSTERVHPWTTCFLSAHVKCHSFSFLPSPLSRECFSTRPAGKPRVADPFSPAAVVFFLLNWNALHFLCTPGRPSLRGVPPAPPTPVSVAWTAVRRCLLFPSVFAKLSLLCLFSPSQSSAKQTEARTMAEGGSQRTRESPCEGSTESSSLPGGVGRQGKASADAQISHSGSSALMSPRGAKAFTGGDLRHLPLSFEFQQAARLKDTGLRGCPSVSGGVVSSPFLCQGSVALSDSRETREGKRSPSSTLGVEAEGTISADHMQTVEGKVDSGSQSRDMQQTALDTPMTNPHGHIGLGTFAFLEMETRRGHGESEASRKVAQMAKRCRRSSVLCCRCRESPTAQEAVSASNEGEDSDRKRSGDCEDARSDTERSPPSTVGKSRDCCSCCYCSCCQQADGKPEEAEGRHSEGEERDRQRPSLSTSNTWQPTSRRIICIDGPSRPETFERNLRQLSDEFPCIHQGLIISLLETAENNLSHARQLVQVVSDTTLSSSRGGSGAAARGLSSEGDLGKRGPGGSCSPGDKSFFSSTPDNTDWEQALSWRPASRKRQMEREDVASRPRASSPRLCDLSSFLQTDSASAGGDAAPASSASLAAAPTVSRVPSGSLRAAPNASASCELRNCYARGSWASREAPSPPNPATAGAFGNSGAGLGVTVELWSVEWTQRMLRVIYSATSAEDAKAKLSALMQEQTEQLLNIHAGTLSVMPFHNGGERETGAVSRETTSGVDPVGAENGRLEEMEKKVELLQTDKLLLARAVKAQHERIQSLQAALSEKTTELERVQGEKRVLQQDVQKIKDAAAALLLGSSSLRAGSSCRDNNSPFDRPFPDVC